MGKNTQKKKKGLGDIKIGGPKKATPADLSLFTRQLATLLDAGLPLVRSLKILQQQQAEGHQLSVVLKDVQSTVESGKIKLFLNLFLNTLRFLITFL